METVLSKSALPFLESQSRDIVVQPMIPPEGCDESVADRQELLEFNNPSARAKAKIAVLGAGALAFEVVPPAGRKGFAQIDIWDFDIVSFSNLSRCFRREDLYRKKVFCLAEETAAVATLGLKMRAHPVSFEDAVVVHPENLKDVTMVGCFVDDQQTRYRVSDFYRPLRIPVIHAAADERAECGYVFVEEPGKATFRDAFPEALMLERTPCRVPSMIDILKTLGGIVLFLMDSLIMDRPRDWNFRLIHLSGIAPDIITTIPKT